MMDDSFFIIAIFLYSTLVIMISFYRYYIDISFLIMIYAQTVNQILLQKNSVSINYTVNFVSNYNISIIHYSNDISKKKKESFVFINFQTTLSIFLIIIFPLFKLYYQKEISLNYSLKLLYNISNYYIPIIYYANFTSKRTYKIKYSFDIFNYNIHNLIIIHYLKLYFKKGKKFIFVINIRLLISNFNILMILLFKFYSKYNFHAHNIPKIMFINR